MIPASQPFDASARVRLEAIAAWPPKVGREFGQNLACLPPAAARYLTAAAAGDRLGAALLADRLAVGRHHPLTAAQMLTRQPPPWIVVPPLWVSEGD